MAAESKGALSSSTKPSSSTNNRHAAQYERYDEYLRQLRSHKQELIAKGITGWDLFEAMTALTLNHRETISHQHRCHNCWLDSSRCICSRLSELVAASTAAEEDVDATSSLGNHCGATSYSIKLLVLMHSKEYLCAGNSAKLLRMVLPKDDAKYAVEYYIFGKVGDVDRLHKEMNVDRTNTLILWPDKHALSVAQFLNNERQSSSSAYTTHDEQKNSTSQSAVSSQSEGQQKQMQTITIRAVVLDGTYSQARNMYSSLKKHIGEHSLPVAVQLRPTSSSVFHRAQKNYGQAHRQQQKESKQITSRSKPESKCTHEQQGKVIEEAGSDTMPSSSLAQRVSTAEACGLLLIELGVTTQAMQERITQAVLINNEALGHAERKNSTPSGNE